MAMFAALHIFHAHMQTSSADKYVLLLDNTYDDLINPRLQSGGAWVSLRGQGKNPTCAVTTDMYGYTHEAHQEY